MSSIASLTAQRDALASQIRAALNAAAFDGQALNEQQAKGWIDQANTLIQQAKELDARLFIAHGARARRSFSPTRPACDRTSTAGQPGVSEDERRWSPVLAHGSASI